LDGTRRSVESGGVISQRLHLTRLLLYMERESGGAIAPRRRRPGDTHPELLSLSFGTCCGSWSANASPTPGSASGHTSQSVRPGMGGGYLVAVDAGEESDDREVTVGLRPLA
jgi:hypothetical protein